MMYSIILACTIKVPAARLRRRSGSSRFGLRFRGSRRKSGLFLSVRLEINVKHTQDTTVRRKFERAIRSKPEDAE